MLYTTCYCGKQFLTDDIVNEKECFECKNKVEEAIQFTLPKKKPNGLNCQRKGCKEPLTGNSLTWCSVCRVKVNAERAAKSHQKAKATVKGKSRGNYKKRDKNRTCEFKGCNEPLGVIQQLWCKYHTTKYSRRDKK